jgi:Tfp pilus assembly protein PilV
MTTRTPMAGFTLVELVAIIVLLSVGIVAMLQVFGAATRTISYNVDGQVGAQLAQERAEQLLADRRSLNPARGYNAPSLAVGTVNEVPVATFPNYWRRTQIVGLAGGTPPCPAGATCKQVQVTVVRTGQLITQPAAQVTFMLANY